MKILWMTWKDISHPLAGGAEVVQHEVAKRLVDDGHELIVLSGHYAGAAEDEIVADGYRVIRVGGRYSVYVYAYFYYKKHLRGWADVAIDEMNTIPFFAKFYVKERTVMIVHQLCREIWYYQMSFPLSAIGCYLEPLYLRILNDQKVITVSESTKKDLIRHGFGAQNISVISEGVQIDPVKDLATIKKYEKPTILSLGSVRAMKRTSDIIEAFDALKAQMPTAKLIVAGDMDDPYAKQILSRIKSSPFESDIEVLGRVSADKKQELMQKAHLIAVTSVKEGWGLIVSEAASQGTSAVVYDVDGLRDSVRHGETGHICSENMPADLAESMYQLLRDKERIERLSHNAWQWSKEITFDQCYADFLQAIELSPETSEAEEGFSRVQVTVES